MKLSFILQNSVSSTRRRSQIDSEESDESEDILDDEVNWKKGADFYSLITKNPSEFSLEEVEISAGQKIILKVKYSFMGFCFLLNVSCVTLRTDCQWQLRTVNVDERIKSSGLTKFYMYFM